MNQLQQRALARVALSETAVGALYDGAPLDESGRLFRTLCESHERLRAELQGVLAMMDEALALTDTGSEEFKKAFGAENDVVGWRVVEKIREALGG